MLEGGFKGVQIEQIPIEKLKCHSKNEEYYSSLSEEKYEQIKHSIKENGIRDPLKVLPDYTIIAGHQRFRIAQELELTEVPVVIMDISPEEAEYLLIADNDERRQGDNDPIKKAKRAKFLQEYWGIRRGGDRKSVPQNEELKTNEDVAKAVGTNAKNLDRLLRLNNLIPEFQELTSNKKLGTTHAGELARLNPENQKNILGEIGAENIIRKNITEIKQLCKDLRQLEKLENNKEHKLENKQIDKTQIALIALIQDLQANMKKVFEQFDSIDDDDVKERVINIRTSLYELLKLIKSKS
jgi:ParB family chromosome partitioning protein